MNAWGRWSQAVHRWLDYDERQARRQVARNNAVDLDIALVTAAEARADRPVVVSR